MAKANRNSPKFCVWVGMPVTAIPADKSDSSRSAAEVSGKQQLLDGPDAAIRSS
jgi:hypothetical protein